ncbi:MAG: patatin-like phospholipase family protein [Caldilineales bacterium]|nr:patatin-like phospholipase family protein [Caldilineales bacterium]MDW8316971.1 patatin-like phospholipase family protein [Anaerolineae bacterium]
MSAAAEPRACDGPAPDAARRRPRIGLALAGGVMRGRAHLGVLQVLEEAGIRADLVSGVSAGAVVAALYASGMSVERMLALSRHYRWRKIVRPILLNPFRSGLDRLGLFDFYNLEMELIRAIGDVTFDELPIPLVVGATDLLTGEAVNITSGRVAAAVRASASVPGFVAPVRYGGRLLCDGFASNNLRLRVLHEMGADVVIGVNIMPLLHRRPRNAYWAGSVALSNLISRSLDPCDEADVLIEPDVAEMDFLIPDHIELVQRGRAAAEAALPRLRALLG